MLQRIGTEILTPRGRIVDICNIDMFDNNGIHVSFALAKSISNWLNLFKSRVQVTIPAKNRQV